MKKILVSFWVVLVSFLLGVVNQNLFAQEDLEEIQDTRSKNVKTKSSNNDYEVILSTDFNFSETSIMGNMKTPDGFYLQGNKNQDLQDMVKLRSSFKQELLDSYNGVRSVAK